MKKNILILLIIILNISGLKAQDLNFNDYFFNSYTAFHSLGDFIKEDSIIIYDKDKKISATDLEFSYTSDTSTKCIKIVHSIPNNNNYLIVTDYIINDNLSVISFANSEKKKYIVFTSKRDNKDDKWWFLLSIFKGSMN